MVRFKGMTVDEQFMQRCLELSKLGLRAAYPNPSVGCVVVVDNEIVGEGYTSAYGGNHAEVNAIESVADKSLLTQATVYVSLEPCSHHGKTPPCSDMLIKSGVFRVVVGCKDPFAEVNGAGIERLENAGIQVDVGILQQECIESHKRFITFHEKKRPYVILKWAETEDGFVDKVRTKDDPALKITCDTASTLVHKWRSEEHSILIGKNTALMDNPTLTTRKHGGENPIRVLLDSNQQIPSAATVFNNESETIVIDNNTSIKNVLSQLYDLGISSVLVEGGPKTHRSFYESGNWDEIRRFISPNSISDGVKAISVKEKPNESSVIGCDRLFIYRNR